MSCHVLYCGSAQLGPMYSSVAMHNLGQLGPTEILVSLSFSYSEILETNLRFSWFHMIFKWTVWISVS